MNKNILIIDDEVEILHSLQRQFRRKYNVLTCSDPKEAIIMMKEHDIQVVISDQRMPELSGVELFGILKESHPDTIRLLLTGYTDIEAVIDAINHGSIYRYIQKPWNSIELEAILNEAFEKYDLIHTNRNLMLKLKQHNKELDQKVKARTEELEKINQNLEILNSEKNTFIRTAAHDLRNPIGVAASMANLIALEINSLPQNLQIEYLNIIEERCDYSLNLINNLLDISKIESGQLDIAAESIDYKDLIQKTIEFNRIFAKLKNIEIKTDYYDDPIIAMLDKQRIEQVLTNLVSNAVKYSYPDSQVIVKVSRKGAILRTTIIDSGIGINEEEHKGLFTPFYKASSRPTGGETSTGLGLAIVKKIVTEHGGSVGFRSKPGTGSEFWFDLPQ